MSLVDSILECLMCGERRESSLSLNKAEGSGFCISCGAYYNNYPNEYLEAEIEGIFARCLDSPPTKRAVKRAMEIVKQRRDSKGIGFSPNDIYWSVADTLEEALENTFPDDLSLYESVENFKRTLLKGLEPYFLPIIKGLDKLYEKLGGRCNSD